MFKIKYSTVRSSWFALMLQSTCINIQNSSWFKIFLDGYNVCTPPCILAHSSVVTSKCHCYTLSTGIHFYSIQHYCTVAGCSFQMLFICCTNIRLHAYEWVYLYCSSGFYFKQPTMKEFDSKKETVKKRHRTVCQPSPMKLALWWSMLHCYRYMAS